MREGMIILLKSLQKHRTVANHAFVLNDKIVMYK